LAQKALFRWWLTAGRPSPSGDVVTAAVVPFPLARRGAFIQKQANRAAEMNADAGERHIQQQIKIQADAMRRRGIDEDLIAREMKCMETAVRAALWKAVLGAPVGAL
jgi:hypothetical protein